MTSPARPAPKLDLALPREPVLSSFDAGWESLHLALHRQPAHDMPEHRSSEHVICLNAGIPVTLQQTVDGRSATLNSVPGDIGIYPAHLWQSFQWDREAAFLQLYVDPAFLTRAGMALGNAASIELIPQLTALFDPFIYEMAIALKTTLESDRTGSRLYADAMATALAAHLIARYATRKPRLRQYEGGLTDRHLTQAIDYIHANLDRNLSLDELACVAHLSPYYFARSFKQSTGIAPHQYHISCRIDRAKQLLRARELTIAAVALAVGFASQGHLNYHFKRRVGITPKQFLQQ